MNRTKLMFSVAIFGTMIALIYYYAQVLQPATPIQQGVVDLSATDFDDQGVLALDGEWEFYWNQFIDPAAFKAAQPQDLHNQGIPYMKVPGNWLKDIAGNTYDAKGYASYRAVIEHIPNNKFYGLKKANIRNASRIYVNGELLIEDGKLATHLDESVAGNHPKVVYFELRDSTAEIIVHAANHEYIVGGIAKPMLFGTQAALMRLHTQKIVFEFAMLLIVVIIGLFYLLLLVGNPHYRTREPVTLPLALSCLSFGVMNSIYSERIITLLHPEITLYVTFRFGHVMSVVSVMVVCMVIHQVNPAFVSNRVRNGLLVFYGILLASVLTLPLEVYLRIVPFYLMATVMLFFFVWLKVFTLFLKTRIDADRTEHQTFMIAVFGIFLFWLDFTLYSLGIKGDMFLSFVSIAVYSIALAALLIGRYIYSYKKNEELSLQLIETFSTLDQTTKEAQRNELAFLQAQIKPHFLFNALSSIISLCYTNGERAGRLLTELSNYLKRSFQIDLHADYVSIENELKLIAAFVTIEQARFGDRMRMVYAIDEEVLSFKILPLVIEPLVENAIRHGILKNKSGGEVKLTILKQAQGVFVCVEDNGKGMADRALPPQGTGVSLSNIEARLHSFYGIKLCCETSDRGTKVYFTVPMDQTSVGGVVVDQGRVSG